MTESFLLLILKNRVKILKGESVKEAALETFSGKWAKKNEFTKVRFNEDDIKKNRVVLNFLK